MQKNKGYDTFRLRMFRSASLIAFIFFVISSVQNIATMGLNPVSWFTIALLPLFGTIYFLSFRVELDNLTIPFTILINLSYFFLWFVIGGYKGTTPIFIFIIIFAMGIYSKPKQIKIKMIITGMISFLLFAIQMKYPDWIINTVPLEIAEIDFFISFIVVVCFFILAVYYFFENYRKQNEALSTKTIKLKEANENQDKLYKIISHDLRNPMSALTLGMQTISNDIQENLDEETYDIFEALTESSKQANLLLENILSLTRLKTSSLSLIYKEIDLIKIISDEINLMYPAARQKNIEIINNVQKNKTVRTDPNIFSIILRNLLTNAIKFTDREGLIELSTETKDNKVWLCIKDNGRGINSQTLEKILSEADLESSVGTIGEIGTGIGFKLVVDLVRKMGENIFVNSSIGVGTEIYLSLSLVNNETN